MKYDATLMLISLKYAKDILLKYGSKQRDNTYLLDGRIYTLTDNSVSSKPM